MAGPRRRRPRAGAPRHRRALRRVPAHPRSDRPGLPLLEPGRGAGLRRRRSATRCSDVLDAAPLRRRGRSSGTGSPSAMIAQHEQQHDETMLATHQLRSGRAVLDAPPPPRRRRAGSPTRCWCPAATFTMGTSHRAVGAGQRAARAPGCGARVRDRHRAGHQRRVPRVHRRRRLRRPELWSERGLGSTGEAGV